MDQVVSAIRATRIHSLTSYSWFDEMSPRLPKNIKIALQQKNSHNYLLFMLQSQLYSDFYCRGFAVPAREQKENHVEGIKSFVNQLAQANTSKGCWETGWEVQSVEDNTAVVSRSGLELRVKIKDLLVSENCPITSGSQVRIPMPKEFLNMSPGYYVALGDRKFNNAQHNLVRIYWNVREQGAVRLMHMVTNMFNQAEVPFQFKTINDPKSYNRCDAAVLYIDENDFNKVLNILHKIISELLPHLKSGIPAFSKPLATGVGLAEDPEGESFGMHRCKILADGLLRAYLQRKEALEERIKVVVERFAESGIKMEQPFLRPGSNNVYNFEIGIQQQDCQPTFSYAGALSYSYPDSSEYLCVAEKIGQCLVQNAVWYQDRCNWIGADRNYHSFKRPYSIIYKALSPDLYSGTSGVAMFLAELYVATRDNAVRRTAIGAIRHALSRAVDLQTSSRVALYTGWIGIALAASRIGIVLEEEDLVQHATKLLHCILRKPSETNEFDLLSGTAGAIAGLVVLQEVLKDKSLLEFAGKLGDELLMSADKSSIGYSWKSNFPTHRNLTGFSHGAAGVGYSLLELYHATGDSRYRIGAEQAFRYEHHWFDSVVGNWPDFRKDQGHRRKIPNSFSIAWCHGAPGIALSRLRSYKLLKDELSSKEALVALETTRTATERMILTGTKDFSLCHGLLGNAEALMFGNRVLGTEVFDAHKIVRQVTNMTMKYVNWACSHNESNITPCLMLGLAGIGYFNLRLYNHAAPSILMLEPEAYRGYRPQIGKKPH